jgi:hypothetical protein
VSFPDATFVKTNYCSQLDAQLADMDSHREKALAAVAKGNSVLQDAANTLRTLKGKYRT